MQRVWVKQVSKKNLSDRLYLTPKDRLEVSYSPAVLAVVQKGWGEGLSKVAIARRLGWSPWTLYKNWGELEKRMKVVEHIQMFERTPQPTPALPENQTAYYSGRWKRELLWP